jgi:hypothetical protein
MPAELIPFGAYAYGAGGDFERECASALRDQLPAGFIIATNVFLQRGSTGFYECDAIVAAPGICDILEMKCVRAEITVGEDIITSPTGFTIDRPLSTLDHKAKVLASRRKRLPFPTSESHLNIRVESQVVVPSNTRIHFKNKQLSAIQPVRTLSDTILKYRDLSKKIPNFANVAVRRETREAWVKFRDDSAPLQRRTQRHLGRFAIRRQLSSNKREYEFVGIDEPPVSVEVRLREFPFDPALPTEHLTAYLKEIARESCVASVNSIWPTLML